MKNLYVKTWKQNAQVLMKNIQKNASPLAQSQLYPLEDSLEDSVWRAIGRSFFDHYLMRN